MYSLVLAIRELCCDNCETQLDAQIGMSRKSRVSKKDIEITKKVDVIDASNHSPLGIAAQHIIILQLESLIELESIRILILQ